MTEFEKFWQRQEVGDLPASWVKEFAEKVWHAAQRAVIRTISEPPYVPQPGEKIRYLSLCHPNTLGKVKEVTDVKEDTLKVHWVGTKDVHEDGETYFSSGILGEVEKAE